MHKKLRVITKTEQHLRALANKLDHISDTLIILADELSTSDARETRPDPRLRRKPKVSKRG